MSRILTNGVELNAYEMGAGPPVVMLHGLLVGNLASWYFTGARSVAKGHRVLLYDLRGHGRSERPRAGYDAPTMTDDLEGMLDAWEVTEPVSLVGHSFGALISLKYAIRHPERVDRLVLVEAPLEPAPTKVLTEFLALEPDEMLDALPEELRAVVLGGGRRGTRLLDALRYLAYETTLLEDISGGTGVTDAHLAGIQSPSLLVFGDRSACRPAGDRMMAHMPNATLKELEGGHYLPLEQPAALAEAMETFLG